MKKLKTKHLFKMIQIIDICGIANEIKNINLNSGDNNAETQTKLGLELMSCVVSKLWRAEQEVYELLAELNDRPVQEIKNLEIDEIVELLKELVQKGIVEAFFKQATSVAKK